MIVPASDRRQFLRLLGGAAASWAAPGWLRAAENLPSDLVRISILHTTDLHGHILPTLDYNGRADLGGMARCVTQIRRWRKENPNSLLIDVGDVYQGTEFALHDQGRMMIKLFNLLSIRRLRWVTTNLTGVSSLSAGRRALGDAGLAANTRLEGNAAGDSTRLELSRKSAISVQGNCGIKPVIGLTTPECPLVSAEIWRGSN